jgi:hypothetical protein
LLRFARNDDGVGLNLAPFVCVPLIADGLVVVEANQLSPEAKLTQVKVTSRQLS